MRRIQHAAPGEGSDRKTRRSRRQAVVATAGLLLAATVVVPLAAFAADGPFTIDGIVPDANTAASGIRRSHKWCLRP